MIIKMHAKFKTPFNFIVYSLNHAKYPYLIDSVNICLLPAMC